jgi:alpha/beta superfamily hydrolase
VSDASAPTGGASGSTPLGQIGVLAVQDVAITPRLRHLELFTRGGLLTVLWHGPRDATAALVACGGAMGGLLGPSNGLFQFLGDALAEEGIATLRVSYRRPNDLDACVVDAGAACEMAIAEGARSLVVMGHSFGGAVAIQCAAYAGPIVGGVVTLATQSAGCEVAGMIADRELLLVHGGRDEILPVWSSEVVKEIAGAGELIVYPPAGHLLLECEEELKELLPGWVRRVLTAE